MAERRSINDALALPPEKLAFIHGAQTAAKTEPVITTRPAETSSDNNEPQKSTADSGLEKKPVSKKRVGRRRPRSVEKITEPKQETGLIGQLLVPLTTRLRPKTAEALRRACLEQKLAGRQPHTQQDIIEAAAQRWLRDNGFLQ